MSESKHQRRQRRRRHDDETTEHAASASHTTSTRKKTTPTTTRKPNKARTFPRFQLPATADDPFLFSASSYNMLAGGWDTQVMYDYVAPRAADPEFRLDLLRRELLALSADVMCVQEIDLTRVHNDFVSLLADHGYGCVVQDAAKRGKGFTMGLATFFRKSKFALEWSQHRSRTLVVALRCKMRADEADSSCCAASASAAAAEPVVACASTTTTTTTTTTSAAPDVTVSVADASNCVDLKSEDSTTASTSTSSSASTTTATATTTATTTDDADSTLAKRRHNKRKKHHASAEETKRNDPTQMVYIVNVHLDAAPDKGFVRIAQLKSVFKRLDARISETTSPSATAATSAVVVCGDFNSSVEDPAYRLMMDGELEAGATDSGLVANNDHYTSPLGACRSAYSKHGGEPDFSYCGRHGSGTVDFLFGSAQLTPTCVMSVFEDSEDQAMVLKTRLPNIRHGSDHLPVAAVYERTTAKLCHLYADRT